MRVKPQREAPAYEAANHHGVRSVRLQGFEAGGPEKFWVGHSNFEPGGGAGPDSSPLEKVYVVLSGEMTLIAEDGREQTIGADGQRHHPANVTREIVNRGSTPVEMIVVMPYPEKAS